MVETKKSSAGKRLIIAILSCVGVIGVASGCRQQQKGPAAGRGEMGPIPVVVGTVEQKDVPIYLDGLGNVQAFNTVTVRARVDGQVIKVAFTEGQDVKAGDLLAQIDPAPYQTQLDQNIAKKAQDEAQLENAQIDFKRDAPLLADNIISQQVYDTAKALVDQYVATVKADQAAIDSAQVQLNYTKVTSPVDGRTGIRLVDAGNIVHASDSNGLVVITQLKPISVMFTLPEQTLGEIHKQMSSGTDLKVRAMDRDNSTLLDEGKLAVIDNQIDAATATIKLKATFLNENLPLWPGQFVNVRLLLTTRSGPVVPSSVIQRGPEGSYAFVVNGGGSNLIAQTQPVKVAQTADGKDLVEAGQALIESGLKPGERVVVDGQYRLQ
ncbi:MAG TPA: efflux RND transporter periplasmic adaptor subunit, partial [Verrucomicrobiae bacterium]|nr:efflux RND transporter periplasmic adaptor subunit [Verrucomicrobiae bacterium]